VTAQPPQRDAQMVVRLGERRPQRHALAQMLGRERQIAALQRGDAEQMPGIGIARIELDGALIVTLCEAELARAVLGHSVAQLFDRGATIGGAHAGHRRSGSRVPTAVTRRPRPRPA
jgi:hypothetical protein